MLIFYYHAAAPVEEYFCWYRLCAECKYPEFNSKSNFHLVSSCSLFVSRDLVPLKCCGRSFSIALFLVSVFLWSKYWQRYQDIPAVVAFFLWRIHCTLVWHQNPENKWLAAVLSNYLLWWLWPSDLEVTGSLAFWWKWISHRVTEWLGWKGATGSGPNFLLKQVHIHQVVQDPVGFWTSPEKKTP